MTSSKCFGRRSTRACLAVLLSLSATACHRAPKAQQMYQQSLTDVYEGRFQAAIAGLSALVRLEPRNGRAYYLRGFANKELQKLPEAIDDLSKAFELDPALTAVYYQRGLARRELGDPVGALADFNAAVQGNPGVQELFYARAGVLAQLGRSVDAEKDLDKALALKPDFRPALEARGRLRANRWAFAEALADYDRAIALDPSIASVYLGRGEAHYYSGKMADDGASEFKAAVADFTKAISLQAGNPNLYTWRGVAKHSLYDHQGAIDDFAAALNAVRDPAVYIHRADENEGFGVDLNGDSAKLSAAISDLGRAIELAPKLSDGYFRRADTYRVMDDYENAERDSQTMLKLNPKDKAALAELCAIARKRKQNDAAADFCQRAIDLDPRFAAPYRERCELYTDAKQWRKALDDCNRAVEFNPGWDAVWTTRADVYAGLKQYGRALDDYNHSFEMNSHNRQRFSEEFERVKAKLGKGS